MEDSFTPKMMADRQEIYALMGEITSQWSMIEDELGFIFASCLGAERPYAMRAFHAVFSLEVRLAMVDAVAVHRFRDSPKLLESWSTLANAVSKKAKKRAEVAHSAVYTLERGDGSHITQALPYFGVSKFYAGRRDTPPDAMPLPAKGVALSAKDLRERLSSFIELHIKLASFRDGLRNAIARLPKSHGSKSRPRKKAKSPAARTR